MFTDRKMTTQEYELEVSRTRAERMRWWDEARFGMFIHYSVFSLTGTNEWTMALDGYTPEEYEEEFTRHFHPKKGCAEEWVKLAKTAGCKYMVLTTRHHEGYSLWKSEANPYNVVDFGGDYDVVEEYVTACRKYDMKIGFYHSIMDWHHPDGQAAAYDFEARLRFMEYHKALLKELLTNYGKIDILWYDVCLPFGGDAMNMAEINRMVRRLQPDIIINPRSDLPEDMETPENVLVASERYWESCMTMNDLSWGYIPSEQAVPFTYSAQQMIKWLSKVCRDKGNLLLNVGPAPDGSIPPEALERMQVVGDWVRKHEEAVYGICNKASVMNLGCNPTFISSGGICSVKGNTVYQWCLMWPDREVHRIGGIMTKVTRVRCLSNGQEYPFEQDGAVIRIFGLPKENPDPIAGIPVLAYDCVKPPKLIYAPGSVAMTRMTQLPEIEE